MTQKIKVLLVEDSPEYRHVISFAFEDDPKLELIDKFGTAEQALRHLQSPNLQQIPDVILLDLNLPGMSGIEAIHWLTEYVPKTKIIILTQSRNEADVLSSIERGAAGYLLKSASAQEIKSGIQIVMEGGASLDPKMANFLLHNFKKQKAPTTGNEILSSREMEILSLISQGQARKEISKGLKISSKTVDNHIAHIFEKLNVVNAPSAVAEAYKTGILPTHPHSDEE
ncbi:response regulator transcription factor [Coraliomargarita algicola]|uniref:Response regulator transcription factor n=1 Tax=Coraliomargarita algicola TaxID=3092156 RepID=A0ABZ0RL93_9BACT|nr:response regulator transcription factor [Coraliomargarita sp. J2-16]WPJ95692.1 response regulator transcription factor [Coraliomargarita sp. J2-16]